MREMRCAYKIFTGNPKRKRPLERPRLRWELSITMKLKETV
jgi:hypothetical protein